MIRILACAGIVAAALPALAHSVWIEPLASGELASHNAALTWNVSP